MRQNFRVKMDFSRIYQDARQLSWVYIDSTKIFYVNQLAEHVQKLFEIKKPFHFMSKYEEIYLFLPFEEDIRVLENNDTVMIIPGTGISSSCNIKNGEYPEKMQNGFIETVKSKERESYASLDTSCSSIKSSVYNNVENVTETLSLSADLYTTAMHDTDMYDGRYSKTTDDNITEDKSIVKETVVSSKRKRVRKKKQKKLSDLIPESETSVMELSGKKPKIIDSIWLSSGKHIRFKGLEEEHKALDTNTVNENNIHEKKSKNEITSKKFMNENLTTLLNLRQSSTPLTFGYRKIKKESISETNENCKVMVEYQGNIENSQSSKSIRLDDTISFKVRPKFYFITFILDYISISLYNIFRMGENYTPQLSNVIVAKVLSYNAKDSQYTLKILVGKDQLQEPEGKFSLPKDEENESDEINDIVTLEKSKLLALTKIGSSL